MNLISIFDKIVLNSKGFRMNNFSREVVDGIIIEIVNLERATMQEAEEFKNTLLKEINNGEKKIIVDFHKCEFMDSSFLGALIITFKQAAQKGGSLKVCGIHSDTQVILEITGTSKLFDLYKSRHDAIKSFDEKLT